MNFRVRDDCMLYSAQWGGLMERGVIKIQARRR